MLAFQAAVDIANRGADHVGSARISRALGFSEQSKTSLVLGPLYHPLRRAELQRNTWRFAIRLAVLRAINHATTMVLAPALWIETTTYFVGSIVIDEDGTLWQSNVPNNLGNQPEVSSAWSEYFGPLTVSAWTAGATTYEAGELVYTAAGDGTNRVYLSLISANADTPATATAWSATATYFKNQVVTYLSVAYMSLVDLNTNQVPLASPAAWTTVFVGGTGSLNWLQIGGAEFPMGVTLTRWNEVYPLGAGPSSQATTANIFMLPAGFLKKAPQDPKAGAWSIYGAPGNALYDDWLFQGRYIISSSTDPIRLRFVADTVDVATFDDMFCEGLGARMGYEGCEALTQSSAKKADCEKAYDHFMRDARTVNAILIGSEEAPLDDFLACRL